MKSLSPKLDPQSRFEALWARNSSGADNGAEIAGKLLRFYRDSARHYHTFEHIEFCLGLLDEARDECADADAVELAIWFHDAIYNFPVVDNEKQSADYFMQVSDGELAEALRQKVYLQIIATDHKHRPEDPDQQLLVDIDLSSFGQPWDKFIEDGVKVRRELAYLGDEDFYPQQIGFMKQLVAREKFYNTVLFQDRFEQTARNNLSRYLESLNNRGFGI